MKDFEKIIWRDAVSCFLFAASWCGACRAIQPVIDRFQIQMNGRVDIYRVDIDDPDLRGIVRRYRITAVPTLLFFRRGELLWRHAGTTAYENLVAALDRIERYKYACYF